MKDKILFAKLDLMQLYHLKNMRVVVSHVLMDGANVLNTNK